MRNPYSNPSLDASPIDRLIARDDWEHHRERFEEAPMCNLDKILAAMTTLGISRESVWSIYPTMRRQVSITEQEFRRVFYGVTLPRIPLEHHDAIEIEREGVVWTTVIDKAERIEERHSITL